MSKLIKSISKGIKKVFKAVKKVVKKIVKSKIFKAIVIAAAIYFTAGAAAGFLGSTGAATAAAGAGASAGVTTATTAAQYMAAFVPAAAPAATGIGATVASAASGVGTWLAANPLMASTALTTTANVVGGYSKAKAEEKAYEKDVKEMESNNSFQLNVKDRIQARAATNSQPRSVSSMVAQPQQQAKAGSFYDESTDTYKSLG